MIQAVDRVRSHAVATHWAFAAAMVLVLSTSVVGQDSLSTGVCLPGDATSPWADETAFFGSEQEDAYVVDMSPFQTSWNTTFGIAPLMKSSKTSSNFFGSLISAQSMSRLQLSNVPFPRPTYKVWNSPGFGVNNDLSLSNLPSSVETVGLLSNQFSAIFTEFATTDAGASYNALIGSIVNRLPSDPGRLHVLRRVVAVNGCEQAAAYAQLAAGTVDANGNVHLRADCFNCPSFDPCPGLELVSGNNIFRVDMGNRDPFSRNVISGDYPFGEFDLGATDWLIQASADTFLTPGMVPSVVTGGDSILLGANFNAEYVRGGTAAGMTADQLHWSGTNVIDQRGSITYTSHNIEFTESTHGHAAILARRFGAACDDMECTDEILIWGLDEDGNPTDNLVLQLPQSVTDNDDSFASLFEAGSGLPNEFNNYRSQVAFRGGNGQVAMGSDAAGNLLVAAQVDHPFALFLIPEIEAQWDLNYIGVARIDPKSGDYEWTMAGYTSFDSGKAILDGPNGNVIGRQIAVTGGTGDGGGPSVSSPMIDAGGNVWFVGTVELNENPGFQTRALLRSVYNPTNFSYQLELVLKFDDVFAGLNSGRNYELSFIDLSDFNSISSGAVWSQNMTESAHMNLDASELSPIDPQTLGGMVMQAQITYDADEDGDYEDCTQGSGSDQEYNVLLFIGAIDQTDGCNEADDCDDGNVCTSNVCDEGSVCKGIQRTYGDLNADDAVDVLDLTCSLDASQGEFDASCASTNADIFPCDVDGSVDAQDVDAAVGAFGGDDLCCALPSGSCCIAGECQDDVTEPDCFAGLGDYRGDGSTCEEVICPAVGACCIAALCFDNVSAGACDSQSGVFFGPQSACLNTVCDPIGACCHQGICSDGLTEDQCSIDDGDYLGDNTECKTTPCATGACCNAGQCQPDRLEYQCVAEGGDYQGNNSDCQGIKCPGPPQVYINEIRIDQAGSDLDEYVELIGPPGASLTGLTYLVIGDGFGGSGVIDAVVDLTGQTIPSDGIALVGEPSLTLAVPDIPASLNFENGDNVTHMVVAGFTGSFGMDLDKDDNGTLDETPWVAELDRIALIEEENPPSNTEYHYGPPTVGPDGTFVPAHVYRCPDGGPGGTWNIGVFDDLTFDTPGEFNPCNTVAGGRSIVSSQALELRSAEEAAGDDPAEAAGGVMLRLEPRGGSGSSIVVGAGDTVIVDAFVDAAGGEAIRGYQVSLGLELANGKSGMLSHDGAGPSVDTGRSDYLFFGDAAAEAAVSLEGAAKAAAAVYDENAVTPTGRHYLGHFSYVVSEDAAGTFTLSPVDQGIAVTGFVNAAENFISMVVVDATIEVSECILHDANCDGTVLLEDHASFNSCLTGPDSGKGAGCSIHDANGDGDIDLHDWQSLQTGFGPAQ